MSITTPKVDQLEIGMAHGFWDYRGRVNFGTGVITLFADDPPRTALPVPLSSYSGDLFSEAPFVLWSIIHTEATAVPGFGGASDQSKINIGASGSSTVDNATPVGDLGTLWNGTARLIQEGGVASSPTLDVNFGFGAIVGSNGASYYVGRIAFLAIGKRLIP
jgi:hypothetical protein